MHSLAQEMTMVTEFTDITEAEAKVWEMKDAVLEGEDPVTLLNEVGVDPRTQWINELEGVDE